METNYLKFGTLELPNYLGFGILDETSTVYENGTLTSMYRYAHDHSPVYRVEWNEQSCTLETFFKDVFYGLTRHRDLKSAFLADFSGLKIGEDKCYLELADAASRSGNAFVQVPATGRYGTHVAFYPAGIIMDLKFPAWLSEKNPAIFGAAMSRLDLFHESQIEKGKLLQKKTNGEVDLKDINIISTVVPVAFLVATCTNLFTMNLVGREKYMRIVAMDAGVQNRSDVQIFQGEGDIAEYAVCPTTDVLKYIKVLDMLQGGGKPFKKQDTFTCIQLGEEIKKK